MRFWKALLDEVMDVFFPGSCPVCGDPPKMEEGHYACPRCLDEIAWVAGSACRFCGIPMQAPEYDGLSCGNCRERRNHFDRGRCLFLLDGVGKRVIHSIKYAGAREVLGDMPHWLDRVRGMRAFLDGAHLVPVPLHRRRESSRGFNQSLWIADAIQRDMGAGVQVADWMLRTRNTPSQTRLEKKKRRKNLKNAFALKPGVCLDSVKRIVLIDDVYTTGATLNACAQACKAAGLQRVEVFTLGHG